jgi:thiol:disulfide interchange protein DsbD
MLKKIIPILFFYVLFLSNAMALSFSNNNDVIRLTIFPQYTTISSEVSSFDIITKVEIKDDWHLYWKNPGDTGEPSTLTFNFSPFLSEQNSKQSYPYKKTFDDIITSYVYKNVFYFKHSFNKEINTTGNEVSFNATFKYSACKEECIPGEVNVVGNIINSNKPMPNILYENTLKDAYKTFPKKINSVGEITNNQLFLKFDEKVIATCNNIEFISENPKNNIIANLPQTIGFNDDNLLQITFDEKPINYNGLILCDGIAYEITPNMIDNIENKELSLMYYIIIAFIAGLILNLMPCVLPILSLKALYILKQQTRSILSSLLYLLGVITSFLSLSAILFYLKFKGEELGWGFQLQSPTFNIFLLVFFFIIFLLMADFIHISDRWTGFLSKLSNNKSFLTGFFAVIIACPCTGPFMGAAIGYAISQPTIIYFSIFIFLGLGYALPYVLIELFPNMFITLLPKPGRWMITLKHFLAIPIALTCIWLGWVIFNQLSFKPYSDIEWEEFSKEKVEHAIKNNNPVFINFTAKWCLICLLNDKTTLATNEFKKLAQEKKLRLFKADWTNRSKKINDALAKYGRNSIPLYVYHPDNSREPIILPQILTNEALAQIIK